jgi:preprotein translocase subunit YajC
LLIINFAVIVISIAITYILVIREAKNMSAKHKDMQARKDKMENNKN